METFIVFTIYCHTHVATGRRYIGLTKLTMMKRWNQHLANATKKRGKGCRYFWNAIRSYGRDAFLHEVLEVCEDLAVANLAEECWIEFFDTRNSEMGFNLARGGKHVPHPEKKNPWEQGGFRERVSASMKEWFRDPVNATLQAARSKEVNSRPEVRQKMSEATSRQFATEESRKAQSELLKRLHADPEVAGRFARGLQTANANRAAKTHCKNGHEFTPKNTRTDDKGWRYCRRCAADRAAAKWKASRTV